jgi:hypothetical protein
MSPEFESLYQGHVIMSYEKQLRLADVIGTRRWSFSMKNGSLTFQEDGEPLRSSAPIVFAVQVLGTASEGDRTWLWSWANEASQIPAALTQDARRLCEVATPREWATSTFAIDFSNADEHRVAMTSSGVLGADAYYRGPYSGGAAFFLLRDERLRLPAPESLRVIHTVMEAISSFSIANHRAAIMAYFAARGLQPHPDGENAIRATIAGGALRAQFDAQDRLAELSDLP